MAEVTKCVLQVQSRFVQRPRRSRCPRSGVQTLDLAWCRRPSDRLLCLRRHHLKLTRNRDDGSFSDRWEECQKADEKAKVVQCSEECMPRALHISIAQ